MTPGALEIVILHTNDMHGHLEQMARLSHFARRVRAREEAEGKHVFFWDAGDAADRRLRLCGLTKGSAFQPIVNAMGYSLQAMGNAISLTYGPTAMRAVAERSTFPILAANCRDGEGGPLLEGLHESATFPLPGGPVVGVVGLTVDAREVYRLFGMQQPDPVPLARALVAGLRRQGAGLVILLSHLGLPGDRRLAEEVEGIDLIIGGHTHDRLPEGELHRGVLIAQAGQFAEALGVVELTVERESGKLLHRSARLLEVPRGEPADPLVLEAIARAEEEAEEAARRPVGVLQSPLALDHFAECAFGNLTADALREYMDAEAALLMSGLLHRGLEGGVVTLGELDAACFTTANPGVSRVSGQQILDALERGLHPAINEVRHRSMRGTPIGIPQISDMTVDYDPRGAPGRRVREVRVGGEPLQRERIYRLAHTDAETIEQVGYLRLEEGQVTEYEVPTILREVTEIYLGRHSPAPPPEGGRWRAR